MITSDIPSQPWKHVSTDTLPRYHSTLLMGTTPHGVRHSLEIYIPIFFSTVILLTISKLSNLHGCSLEGKWMKARDDIYKHSENYLAIEEKKIAAFSGT